MLGSGNPVLVLASSSPRRATLLREWGYSFAVTEAQVSETLPGVVKPDEAVKLLARRKAEEGLKRWLEQNGQSQDVILAADTLVALDDHILGKPDTLEDAYSTLKQLSGKTHQVYTGVALLNARGRQTVEAICTRVCFRELSDAEIYDYIDSGEPFDKAGAYGIQGQASQFVSNVVGSLTNVIGLPMEWLEQELMAWGVRTAR